MIQHKTKRGVAALGRLKAYEGVVPPPCGKVKRTVTPDALKVPRLQAGQKSCLLWRLSSEVLDGTSMISSSYMGKHGTFLLQSKRGSISRKNSYLVQSSCHVAHQSQRTQREVKKLV